MTLEEAIKCLTNPNIHELVLPPNQLAEWLQELELLREKHWDECRQIAIYDDELWKMTIRAIKNNGRAILTNMDNLDLQDENKELKRLLKLAIDDISFYMKNNGSLTCGNCFTCARWNKEELNCICNDDDICSDICKWRYADEAEKLLGERI